MRLLRPSLTLAFSFAALLLSTLIVPSAKAQITNPIEATITHSFIVGNATLPPGTYVFRMMQGTDLEVMTVRNKAGDTGAEFLVRASIDSKTPQHSELIFNRYGDKEFLYKIFERGSKDGVAVIEPSREESRLLKQGQTPVEHSEEQKE